MKLTRNTILAAVLASTMVSCVAPQRAEDPATLPQSSRVAATTGERAQGDYRHSTVIRQEAEYSRKVDRLNAEYRRTRQIASDVDSANKRLQAIQQRVTASGAEFPSPFLPTLKASIALLSTMQDLSKTGVELGKEGVKLDSTYGGTYGVDTATKTVRDNNNIWERDLAAINGRIDAMSEEVF